VESSLSDNERQRLVAQYSEIATLAGGLAHEIKNPLSTIGMNIELMAEDLDVDSSPRDRRLLKKIQTVQRECKNLENILNAFLQFARVGEMNIAAADLNQVVQEFLDFYKPLASECGIEISPHLESGLPTVQVDHSLMRQVLMNLALNAQQAMPNGGLLELQTYSREGRVNFDMIDNGSGMDSRTREKMFQAFFSTKPNGSGLGLPTVRKIIEAHGGSIHCDSEPGRGTRFTVSLPPAGSQT
jgi:two-component system, NtrC family, sensor histidine kinase HydH